MKVDRFFRLACCSLALTGGQVNETSAQSLAIENISIYDVATGTLEVAQNVAILDGRITQVGSGALTALPNNATIIDGAGMTMLPGLTDAHVHMNQIDAGAFLANGVTSVRELNGSQDHLKLRESIARGDVVGPRMLVSSPLISGAPMRFRHVLLESSTDAPALVDELHNAGYDYLKIYDDLGDETYRELTGRARTLKLPYVGHIPNEVGLNGVLAAGQGIEHNEKIVVDVLGHNFRDTSLLADAAQSIAESGVPVTPTLAVHEFLNNRQSNLIQERLTAAEMAYVDSEIVEWWKATFPKSPEGTQQAQNDGARRFLAAQRQLLAELDRLGVPILAGTDTPNPLMIAGFSLHDELEALVRAGLSNSAAIRSATSTAGRHLPWSVRLGEIKVGFTADLILVVGNPADDLSVLRVPAAVIANGVWMDRSRLDELLATARRD